MFRQSKKLFGLLSILAVLSLIITGCAAKNPLIGKWNYGSGSDLVFEFARGGKLTVSGTVTTSTATYEFIDDDTILITWDESSGIPSTQSSDFIVKGDSLILTSAGESITLTRVKP